MNVDLQKSELQKTVFLVFGTRPEAIKMCPLIKELKTRISFRVLVCVTGQHRKMLDQVLEIFNVVPDYDLSIMKPNQTLFDITVSILENIKRIIEKERPDIVLVHGDTSTTFATALAAFYLHIPIGSFHFAPTKVSRDNLIREGKRADKIFVTGNTAIDALKTTIREGYRHPELEWSRDARMILITAHRRENLGRPMIHMFQAIRRVLDEHEDVKAIYPIHLNPVVRQAAEDVFGESSPGGREERLHLIEPLDVVDFHNFMKASYLILTDSGGIQEEAPSLGKPVLVMRDTTERPEGIEAGTLKLVGTDEDRIYEAFTELLEDRAAYERMACASNPYGDGQASVRIADILEFGYTRR